MMRGKVSNVAKSPDIVPVYTSRCSDAVNKAEDVARNLIETIVASKPRRVIGVAKPQVEVVK